MALADAQSLVFPLPCSDGREASGADSAERELAAWFRQAPAALWATDWDLTLTRVAGAEAGAAGIGLVPGKHLYECVPNESLSAAVSAHWRALAGETAAYEHAGRERAYQVRVGPLRDAEEKVIGCLAAALDVSERKTSESLSRFLANTDPLTGLANYRRLLEVLHAEARRNRRTRRPFALVLVDMDGLKRINDQHGHLVGSRALCRLARALREHARAMDTAARFGGDEFALVLPESDLAVARGVIERLRACLAADAEEPRVSAAMGCAEFPAQAESIASLIETADRDLYRDKANHHARIRA